VHAAGISDARESRQSDDVIDVNGTWETNVFVPYKLTLCTQTHIDTQKTMRYSNEI